MSVVESHIPQPMIFTDAAAAKVKTLIEEEGNLDLMLRVFITGGGCSGFQYGFAFEGVVNPDDTVITQSVTDDDEDDDGGEQGGGVCGRLRLTAVKLAVDPASSRFPFAMAESPRP